MKRLVVFDSIYLPLFLSRLNYSPSWGWSDELFLLLLFLVVYIYIYTLMVISKRLILLIQCCCCSCLEGYIFCLFLNIIIVWFQILDERKKFVVNNSSSNLTLKIVLVANLDYYFLHPFFFFLSTLQLFVEISHPCWWKGKTCVVQVSFCFQSRVISAV